MKITVSILLAVFLAPTIRGEWFLHRSTTANSTNNYTLLAPHLTNQRSSDLFIFPIQRPFTSRHLDRSLGIWFPSSLQRWSVFYEFNSTVMDPGLEFAVYRAGAGDTTFRHQHTSAGNPFRRSYLDHPSLNNQPAAFPFITQNWDLGGVYNALFRYSVVYDPALSRWYPTAVVLPSQFYRVVRTLE